MLNVSRSTEFLPPPCYSYLGCGPYPPSVHDIRIFIRRASPRETCRAVRRIHEFGSFRKQLRSDIRKKPMETMKINDLREIGFVRQKMPHPGSMQKKAQARTTTHSPEQPPAPAGDIMESSSRRSGYEDRG